MLVVLIKGEFMASVDKKSDSGQIIQACLDVTNQAHKVTVAGGQTSIALTHTEDSIVAYGPSTLYESAVIDFNVLNQAEIIIPASCAGLSKFQLHLNTTVEVVAVGLSCEVYVSPVDTGSLWTQIITTAVDPNIGDWMSSAVVESLARRVKVLVTANAFTAGSFKAYLLGN